METIGQPEESPQSITQQIQVRIAAKVRADSETLTKLTGLESLEKLAPADVEKIDLAEMVEDEKYQDIKFISTHEDTVYLYSDKYITRESAASLVRDEEIKTIIAKKVRDNSKKLAKLTGVDPLVTLAPDLTMERVRANISSMLKDEKFSDIKSVVITTGILYLYSETFISKSYVRILARAEANDPLSTIADTVREESRVYPRPTSLALFKELVFGIDPDKLDEYVERLFSREEYQDIKLIRASNGARYLYSERHLDGRLAKTQVEWVEVEQDENP